MKKFIATTAIASALMLSPLQAFANIGDVTLKPAQTHTDVKQLQALLKVKSYFNYTGSYTTYYGSYTTDAVKRFQRAKGLTADGISGSTTYKALGVYKVDNTRLIHFAKKFMGVPYVWGGTSPSGFDCSGFIYYVFKEQGIYLPRTSSALYSNIGLRVSAPKAGDLVFFNTSGSGVSHVGIYIGNNEFISATSSKGIAVYSMSNSYWAPKYLGAKTL
ncbi:C40 family peptidase [Peribacillus deserti]|uniref:Endopeptidase n=1 Tax=Peribacillus deserti TaxID=673318 RepID=A0A2N5M1N1_9BACI|nr:NlpC/P60 family protein [Peribacillus deserti]PLT28215.1 endopeptidase [Peribacillus deserti]